jgi:hypothetical protein
VDAVDNRSLRLMHWACLRDARALRLIQRYRVS